MNKCFSIKNKDIKKINDEMTKKNLNTEDMYDSIYNKRKFKKKHANLGNDVISYRIISKKEKDI
jgi:hypothetical protein